MGLDDNIVCLPVVILFLVRGLSIKGVLFRFFDCGGVILNLNRIKRIVEFGKFTEIGTVRCMSLI